MICATLTEDYTTCSDEYSVHYQNLYPPYTREAPVFFERNGKKYLFSSGISGYYPNASRMGTFDDYHGEYRDLGDPCVGDRSNTIFNSQITCVLRLPGTERHIAMADRWKPEWWVPYLSRQIIFGMEHHFKGYTPDLSPKPAVPLPGKEQKNIENIYKSHYVWLPIEWDGGEPVLHWHDRWHVK